VLIEHLYILVAKLRLAFCYAFRQCSFWVLQVPWAHVILSIMTGVSPITILLIVWVGIMPKCMLGGARPRR
jgi:hypothetical protein